MIPKVPVYRNSNRAYYEWRECEKNKKKGKKVEEDCEKLYINYRRSVKEVASLIAQITKSIPYDPSQAGFPPNNYD